MNKKQDKLEILKKINPPPPSKNRRSIAIEAAMMEFDKEQKAKAKKISQGNSWLKRLMSIFNSEKGTFMMQKRIAFGGVAIVGLVLLPLALIYNSSTNLTNIDVRQDYLAESEATKEKKNELDDMAQGEVEVLSQAPQIMAQKTLRQAAPASEPLGFVVPSPTPMPIIEGQSGDKFSQQEEGALFITAQNPVSTFSIDVDTASYSYIRSQLEQGIMPNPDAVRIEEMINYFSYNYPAPKNANEPFSQIVEVYPTPWNSETKLLHIGIKGYEPKIDEQKPSNLVLLIDSSGSMSAPNKLPLLKRSFSLLLNQLGNDDFVSIVAYAGSAGVVLEPTKASEKRKIIAALERLSAGGSTAGGQGIELAYQLAMENAKEGVNSRVILATDGDFNVGISTPNELKKFIEKKRQSGIFLSVLGFGLGNYNDELMQSLAQNGNGNAYYIDNFNEARKVLAHEIKGTLLTIAKDVKIQIEFNPQTIAQYRLIGYESRALKREDFNNDKIDAGDIGAGHTVTAIYEIIPVGSSAISVDALRYQQENEVRLSGNKDEYAYLKLHYKLPNEEKSRLAELPIRIDMAKDNIDAVSPDFRFGAAVAAFGQKLRASKYVSDMSYQQIKQLALSGKGEDKFGYRAEFISLIDIADSLDR